MFKHQVTEEEISVFLYLRTSTGKQDDSPEIQRQRAQAFCDERGWKVVGDYYDIVTGRAGIEKRPRFRQMLVDAPLQGVRGFVGLTFNRFLRHTGVKVYMEETLNAQGLFILGIDDKLRMGCLPNGERVRAQERCMLNMTVSMDQYYAESVGDKIVDHHEHRVSKGLHHSGAPPFGYRLVKDLYNIDGRHFDGWAPDDTPDGSADGLTIAERYDWIVERFLATENMMAIAVELTRLGVPTPRQVQWNRLTKSEQAVRLERQQKSADAGHGTRALPPLSGWDSTVLGDMLRSKTYLGMISYTPSYAKKAGKKAERMWHEGLFQALNTPTRHEQVMSVLEVRGQSNRHPTQTRQDVLLNQMLVCMCGHAMTHSMKNKYQYRYRCNYARKTGGLSCQMTMLNSKAVEAVAYDLLMRGIKVRLDEIRAAGPLLREPAGADEASKEHALLQAKKRRIEDAYFDGDFGDGPEAKADRDARLAPVLTRLKALETTLAIKAQPDGDDLSAALANIGNLWPRFPNLVRREILRTYVPGGFRVVGKRAIQAEVCGVLLEADVPLGEDTRGPKQKGMRRYTWEEAEAAGLNPPEEQEDLSEGRTGLALGFTGALLPPLCQGGQLSERRDSNPRPPLPQSGALPSCATPRKI